MWNCNYLVMKCCTRCFNYCWSHGNGSGFSIFGHALLSKCPDRSPVVAWCDKYFQWLLLDEIDLYWEIAVNALVWFGYWKRYVVAASVELNLPLVNIFVSREDSPSIMFKFWAWKSPCFWQHYRMTRKLSYGNQAQEWKNFTFYGCNI